MIGNDPQSEHQIKPWQVRDTGGVRKLVFRGERRLVYKSRFSWIISRFARLFLFRLVPSTAVTSDNVSECVFWLVRTMQISYKNEGHCVRFSFSSERQFPVTLGKLAAYRWRYRKKQARWYRQINYYILYVNRCRYYRLQGRVAIGIGEGKN